jgi:hypothetical protein
MTTNNYIITGEQVQVLLRYLFTRPYGEVIKMIEILGQLRELDEKVNADFISKKQDKSGEIKLDLDYIKPALLIETFKKKFPDYENSVLLSSIIYDTISIYEDLYDRIKNTITMS